MKFCKKCQTDTERRICDGRCKICQKAYMATWRASNPGKASEDSKAWRLANPGKSEESSAAWRAANPVRMKEYNDAWRAENPEKAKAASDAWNTANPEKRKSILAEWRAANPEADRIHKQNRRARKLASGGRLSKDIAKKLFTLQRGRCACGCMQPLGENYHRDHIMPLALGGTNTDDNMQLLRATCNMQKHAKHPVDFMQSRGFLL